MGTFFVSMIAISLHGVAPQAIPNASGISNFARITAGGFAAAIITTMWDRREALHQSRLAELTNLNNPLMRHAVERLHGAGLSDHQAYGLITHTMTQQSYLLSSTDLFWISGWIVAITIALVWMAERTVGSAGPVAAD
jgi:DHA2 family multidrug resistance protein